MTLLFSYTAMHGVGYPFIQAAFHAFGLPPPIPVPLQVQPDPTFSTVKLPNPEEGAGALQLAFATAQEHGARLVVASDPDADRFVFAELQDDGSWRMFNGNEIGLMYAPPLLPPSSSPRPLPFFAVGATMTCCEALACGLIHASTTFTVFLILFIVALLHVLFSLSFTPALRTGCSSRPALKANPANAW